MMWSFLFCVLQGHAPDGWLFITIWPTQAFITVTRTWKYWQSWDPCCEMWGPWKSKTSWGIILHLRVLTAKEMEDNFNNVITVGNRLNITLLVNLPTRLPCWSSAVMLRRGLRCAREADPRPRRRKSVLLSGAPPWHVAGLYPRCPPAPLAWTGCLSYSSGPGVGPPSLSVHASALPSLPKSFLLSVKLLLWNQVSCASYKWQSTQLTEFKGLTLKWVHGARQKK